MWSYIMSWFTDLFPTRRRVRFVIGPVLEWLFPVEVEMIVALRDTQEVKLKSVEVDVHGDVVDSAGPFTYTSSDETLAKVVRKDDGSQWARSQGKVGNCVISCDDATGLHGDLTLQIGAGAPVAVTVSADGDPTEIDTSHDVP